VAKLRFQYVARTAQGREVKGNVNAESEHEAQTQLRQQQLSVVTLAPAAAAKPLFGSGSSPRRAKSAELALFTRQMSTMLSAGIPLMECLEILSQQTMDQNKGFGLGIQEVADMVRGGSELSESMAKFPRIFPQIYVNMVKAGEASGQLDIILDRLAEFMEATESLKREIKSAMTYPVISLILIFGITGYLLVGVVPKFQTMFTQLGGNLPAITRWVVAVSEWLQGNILTVIGGAIAVAVGYVMAKRTDKGRLIIDTMWLKLPVFGPLFQKVAVSRFARTFGTLLSSGVPILGALEIVATTSGNKVIEDTLFETREVVKRGESITSHLEHAWVFPPMVVKMIGIGERSGALEALLNKVSEFYDEQVHATTKSLTSLIEPIMLVVMGFCVGTIVLAIFLPILELQSAVRGS